MLTDTIIEHEPWQDANLEVLAETAARATLTHLGLDPAGFEIAVLGCDDARIAELNAEFRDRPRATNVLSWPAEDLAPDTPGATPELPEPDARFGPHELGDIAIAWETCVAEARAGGIPLADHVTHLVCHATLHLLGYDHVDDADAALMERIETDILCKSGVADPYADRSGSEGAPNDTGQTREDG